jgi:hypothetical protein
MNFSKRPYPFYEKPLYMPPKENPSEQKEKMSSDHYRVSGEAALRIEKPFWYT